MTEQAGSSLAISERQAARDSDGLVASDRYRVAEPARDSDLLFLNDGPEGTSMSYRNLEVWRRARAVVIEIHRLTLGGLPDFERWETGSQIRRSSKSIRANIVEGFGRRRFKQDFIKFLVYAHASCDETRDHLETLRDCGSLADEALYRRLAADLDDLGRRLNRFIQAVEHQHLSPK